jgi:hypothetical protein
MLSLEMQVPSDNICQCVWFVSPIEDDPFQPLCDPTHTPCQSQLSLIHAATSEASDSRDRREDLLPRPPAIAHPLPAISKLIFSFHNPF